MTSTDSREDRPLPDFSNLVSGRHEQIDRDLRNWAQQPIKISFDPTGTHLFSMMELLKSYARRCVELGDVVRDLANQGKVASAVIVARALIETIAMGCFYLHEMRRLIAAGDRNQLEDRFLRFYAGIRGSTVQPIHVLDAIRHLAKIDRDYVAYLDKKYGLLTTGLKLLKITAGKDDGKSLHDLLSVIAIYDQLSEIAHPNGAGTQYLFPEPINESPEAIKTKERLRRIALSAPWHRFHLLDALLSSADLPEKFKATFLQTSP